MSLLEKAFTVISHGGLKTAGSTLPEGGLYLYRSADNAGTIEGANYFDALAPKVPAGKHELRVIFDDGSIKSYQMTATATAVTVAATKGVQAVAAGLKIATGQATTVAASDTIVTGLTSLVGAMAVLDDAPVIGCDRAQASIGNQSGAPAAGSLLLKTFKPTATGDATPIAATTFGKKVNWVAWGT